MNGLGYTVGSHLAIVAMWIFTTLNTPNGDDTIRAAIVTAVVFALLANANRDNAND